MLRTQEAFKAIADPTRREILAILQNGSRTAGELAESFEISKASLSHHFNVLKNADLVRSERRGQQILYTINTTVFDDLASVLMDLFQMGQRKETSK